MIVTTVLRCRVLWAPNPAEPTHRPDELSDELSCDRAGPPAGPKSLSCADPRRHSRNMTEALVVRTEGLTKAYGQRVALTDLCLEIGAGEVFGYLGPNGAGKTTTLRLLAGMLRPTSGRAQVLGLDSWREPRGCIGRWATSPRRPG